MRDFLGLGKLVGDYDQVDRDSAPEGVFLSAPGLPVNTDSAGVRCPISNLGSAIENRFSIAKNPDKRHLEGGADTFGLACLKQWPGIAVSNAARLDVNAKPSAMQLTIFYGGRVNVYNNIPVDRAEAIMHLAAKGDPLSSNVPTSPYGISHIPGFCQPSTVAENVSATSPMVVPIMLAADRASQNQPLEGSILNTPSTPTSSPPVVPRALPLARKASLARFLEKRKERMQMMSPYFKKQVACGAPGEHMTSLLQNATLSDLQSQYFTRPSFVFRMQEQTDMSSNVISTRE